MALTILRAGTLSPDSLDSHLSQSGHQEPAVSLASFCQALTELYFFSELLVQYCYLLLCGGLITPAIWPEPPNTNFTGPL